MTVDRRRHQVRMANAMRYGLARGEHPLGVQPWGNMYMRLAQAADDLAGDSDDTTKPRQRRRLADARTDGLGSLARLTDEILLELLALLDAASLARLGASSRILYVFAHHDDLWRQLVLRDLGGRFVFLRNWRETYVATMLGGRADDGQHRQYVRVDNVFSDVLFQPWLCTSVGVSHEWLKHDNVDRRSELTLDDFVREYEQSNRPVVITDVVRRWPAFERWSRESLEAEAGEVLFDVGPVEMRLKDYWHYASTVEEESPLYLFDKHFVDKVPSLARDYAVPPYFSEDLFALLGNDRPDYRWLIIGPARSGSAFHIDPNATSAWNACITGSKKWIMYPPGTVPPGVHPSDDGSEVTSSVSLAEWFINFYAETKDPNGPQPIEFIAHAGDLVFVPAGWFHLVMNLEESVAITQNYVSRRNLRQVLAFLRDKPDLISGLRQCHRSHDLYNDFARQFRARFPGELEALEEQWHALEEQERLSRKLPLWDGLKASSSTGAAPFTFGFAVDGDDNDEDDSNDDGEDDSTK